MNQNILETKCLTKSFRNHNAVNQISLAVPKNQVYGLLGPNGAGKSTLLKMMTGILRPTDGQIIFDHDGEQERPCGYWRLGGDAAHI